MEVKNSNKPDKQLRRVPSRGEGGALKKKEALRDYNPALSDKATPQSDESSNLSQSKRLSAEKDKSIKKDEETAMEKNESAIDPNRIVDHEKESMDLHDLKWYHHIVSIGEATAMLKRIGDFLVRQTNVCNNPEFVISVVARKRKGATPNVIHIRVKYASGPSKWFIDESAKQISIFELVKYYQKNHSEFSVEPGPLLKSVIENIGTSINRKQVELSDVHFDKDLGGYVFKGQYNVYKTSAVSDWSPCVIRQCTLQHLSNDKVKEFFTERYILMHYPHEHIVTMLGYCYKETPFLIIYEDLLRPLKRFVSIRQDMTVDELDFISMEVLSAMNFLQENKIVHRNVCSDCIALTTTMKAKLHSFGNAFIGHTLQTSDKTGINVNYIAPEARKKGVYTVKSDVWGFGMFLWELFYRYQDDPIKEQDLVQAIETTMFPLASQKQMPKHLADLYKDCVAIAPADRPDFTFAWKSLGRVDKIKENK